VLVAAGLDSRDARLPQGARGRAGVQSRSQRYPLGETEAQEGPKTVLIYVDTSKQIGDPDHLKVFANSDAALTR
jgi:hypothetical protein